MAFSSAQYFNELLTLTYLAEAVCKLIALGPKYFRNAERNFEFFVMAGSLIDLIIRIGSFCGNDDLLLFNVRAEGYPEA